MHVQLAENVHDVGGDRVGADSHRQGNFLVGHPFGQCRKYLPFTRGQALQGRHDRLMLSPALAGKTQQGNQFVGWVSRFALADPADRPDDFFERQGFVQCSGQTGGNRAGVVPAIVVGGQGQDLAIGMMCVDGCDQVGPGAVWKMQLDQGDIDPVGPGVEQITDFGGGPDVGDNAEIRFAIEHEGNRRAEGLQVVDEQEVCWFRHHRSVRTGAGTAKRTAILDGEGWGKSFRGRMPVTVPKNTMVCLTAV